MRPRQNERSGSERGVTRAGTGKLCGEVERVREKADESYGKNQNHKKKKHC